MPGTIKEMLNGDGNDDPGEDPNNLLAHYCVPCGIGTFCPGTNGEGLGWAGPACRAAPWHGRHNWMGHVVALPSSMFPLAPEANIRAAWRSHHSPMSPHHHPKTPSPPPEGAQNCPAGTYGPALGAKGKSGCVDCPVGTYQDMDGSFSCQTCAPNTFASSPGSTECVSCGDGYEVASSGSNFCNPCAPGSFRDSAASDTCQECPAGTSSGEAAGQCSVCEPGGGGVGASWGGWRCPWHLLGIVPPSGAATRPNRSRAVLA
jgi:hypothetical protein